MTREHFHNRYKYDNRKHKIGGGAFGTVYKAYDRNRDREVAVKVQEIKDIEGKEFSLQLEYDAIKALEDHPNIANYESVWRYEDGPGVYDYAIMQFYPLGNLSNYLKNNNSSIEERSKILVQILQGIAYLHQNKVVHRDIKPGNILVVNRPGEGIIPKITDFGLSKLAEIKDDYSQFQNSFAGGTVEYSSPEQVKGLPLKFNTDLWSFGIIIFEVFTGKTLFEVEGYGQGSAGKQGEIMQQIFKKDIQEDLEKLPVEWQSIAQLCLERDKDKRPVTGRELLIKLPRKYYDLESDLFLKKKQVPKSNVQEFNLEQSDNDAETVILKQEPYDDDKATIVHIQSDYKGTERSIDQDLGLEDVGKKAKTKNRKPFIIAVSAAACVGVLLFVIIKFMGKSNDPEFVAMVRLNEKTGYIDSKGNSILEPTYMGGLNFSEGLAPVKSLEGWNYIDIDGAIKINGNYDLATPFSNELALVKMKEGWFYINRDGLKPFNKVYQAAKLFSDGLAPIKTDNGWRYIDKKGNDAFSGFYDSANSFSNELSAVKRLGKWGFIDKRGQQVISFKYLKVKKYSEGLIGILNYENKWQFIDRNENQVIENVFDQVEIFSEGLAAVRLGDKWGFVDKIGESIIDFKYDDTGNFVNGIAPVELNGKWIFIDKKDAQIIKQGYELVEDFEAIN